MGPRVFRISFRIRTRENKVKEQERKRGSIDRKQRGRGAGSRAAKHMTSHDRRRKNIAE